jgi:hypothetical protein
MKGWCRCYMADFPSSQDALLRVGFHHDLRPVQLDIASRFTGNFEYIHYVNQAPVQEHRQYVLQDHHDVPLDVADVDAPEDQLLEASIPRVPVAPVPGPEIVPQGNGQGITNTVSHEPPQPPKHGGWWFHVDTGANVHATYFPDELAH